MALVQCEDCGGKLSTEAEACPHCGRPNRPRPQPTPPPQPKRSEAEYAYLDHSVTEIRRA